MARHPPRRVRRDRGLQGRRGRSLWPRRRGTPCGWCRRPRSLHFVGRATFEGVTGAPGAGGRVRARPRPRRLPGRSAARARADLAPGAGAPGGRLLRRAGLGQHARQARAPAWRTTCSPARRWPAPAPLVLAPAMNDRMWEHPATQANLEPRCAARGARDRARPAPGGSRRKGEWGVGRLAEPADILAAVEAGARAGADFAPRSLDGLRVLVTAGGTREPIDSVRYVGNRSSGRMGLALAEEAARRGAEVTLIAANVALAAPGRRARGGRGERRRARGRGARRVRRRRRAAHGRGRGRLPAARARGAPRSSKTGRDGLSLELEPTDRRARPRSRRCRRPGQTLVGFAAEHGEGGVERGRGKLERKGLDAVVVNDIAARGHRLRRAPRTRSRSSPRGGRASRAAGSEGAAWRGRARRRGDACEREREVPTYR